MYRYIIRFCRCEYPISSYKAPCTTAKKCTILHCYLHMRPSATDVISTVVSHHYVPATVSRGHCTRGNEQDQTVSPVSIAPTDISIGFQRQHTLKAC